jgi:hypothetical protein
MEFPPPLTRDAAEPYHSIGGLVGLSLLFIRVRSDTKIVPLPLE